MHQWDDGKYQQDCPLGVASGTYCDTAPINFTLSDSVSQSGCIKYYGYLQLSSGRPEIKQLRLDLSTTSSNEATLYLTTPDDTLTAGENYYMYNHAPCLPPLAVSTRTLPAYQFDPYHLYPFEVHVIQCSSDTDSTFVSLQWAGEDGVYQVIPASEFIFVDSSEPVICEADVCEPQLTSFESNATTAGDSLVYIEGSWLDECTDVFIGGEPCEITSVSYLIPGYITCKPPKEGSLGLSYDLWVVCRGVTSSELTGFTYQSPTIISATEAFTDGSTQTVISGTSFGPQGTLVTVTIDGEPCTSASVTTPHTVISCYPPPGVGADHEVQVNFLTSGEVAKEYVFSYTSPSISEVVSTIESGKQALTVTGTNFGNELSSISVGVDGYIWGGISISGKFFGAAGGAATSPWVYDIVVLGVGEINCTIPPGAGQKLPLQVTVGGQDSPIEYIYYFQGPKVVSATPTSTTGGYTTIVGTNFGPSGTSISVTIDNKECKEVVMNHTVIQCKTPEGVGKNLTVTVTSPTGVNAQTAYAQAFSYQSPLITGVITGNSYITLIGQNFAPSGYTGITCSNDDGSTWTFGEAVNTTTMKCYSSGNKVMVMIGGQKTPTIDLVTSVETAGGTVNIIGQCFGSTSVTVYIDNKKCEVAQIITPNSQITCTAPAGAGKNLDVLVMFSSPLVNVSFRGFSYNSPRIFSTTSVDTIGGYVYIKGDNFGPAGTTVNVTIGNKMCSNASVVTAHTIIGCLMPPSVGGSLDVGVNIPIVPSHSQEAHAPIFYFNDPEITAVSSADTDGHSRVTIYGKNFGPASASGVGKEYKLLLNLTTVNGGWVQSAEYDLFDYKDPLIHNVSHPSTTGGNITIYGENFGPTGTPIAIHIGTSCEISEGIGGPKEVYFEILPTTEHATSVSSNSFFYKAPIILSAKTASGGGQTEISGSNFGPTDTPITVTIGGQTCFSPMVKTAHSKIECTVPTGAGVKKVITVTVPSGSTTQFSSAALFNYTAPKISTVPLVPTLGGLIHIQGSDLGAPFNSISVFIDSTKSYYAAIINSSTILAGVPPGSGTNHWVYVCIESICTSAALLSFQSPVFTSSTGASTDGSAFTTLHGSNFGPIGTVVSVYFPSKGSYCLNATVSVQHTQIKCRPPPGVGLDNTILITVGNTGSALSTVSNGFSYDPPALSFATPADTVGGIITICGSNFGDLGTNVTVIIGLAECEGAKVSLAHKQIQCSAPAGVGKNLKVTLNVPQTGYLSTYSNIFSYNPPVVTSASEVKNGMYNISIFGKNFGTSISVAVMISGKPCTVTSVSQTEIKCIAPPGSGPCRPVIVTVPAGVNAQSSMEAYVLNYTGPGFSNASTTTTEGGLTTIYGQNLGAVGDSLIVKIDNKLCANATVTKLNSEVQCVAPQGAGKNLIVHATLVDGTFLTEAPVFSYMPPTVSSISHSDTIGEEISLVGTNFGPVGTNISVMIDHLGCSEAYITKSHQEITCVAPAGAGSNIPTTVCIPTTNPQCIHLSFSYNDGTTWLHSEQISHTIVKALVAPGCGKGRNITIRVVDQTSVPAHFNYSAPTILSTSSPSTRGGILTLTGINFGISGTHVIVNIGKQPCSTATVAVPHTEITCTAPSGTGVVQGTLLVPDDLRFSQSTSFQMTYAVPEIYVMTPTHTQGGTTEIYGDNFGPVGTPVSVAINGASCLNPKVEVNHTKITCTVQPGCGTTLSVKINVSSIYSFTSIFSFAGPSIINATAVNTSGTEETLITGINFGPQNDSVSVLIGGVNCTEAQVIRPHQTVSCYPPPGVGANLSVELCVHCNGLQCTSAPVFRYREPVIKYVPPVPTQGQWITVLGDFFGTINSIVTCATNPSGPTPAQWLNNTALNCSIGEGLGTGLVAVCIAGQCSNSFIFHYQAPTIDSIPSPSTNDSLLTIFGNNFGPDNTIPSVFICKDELCTLACKNATVSVKHTVITCQLPVSVGAGYIVNVTVGGLYGLGTFSFKSPLIHSATSTNTTGGYGALLNVVVIAPLGEYHQNGSAPVFCYNAPSIVSMTPTPTSGGIATVYGNNFGPSGSPAIVTVSNFSCSNVTVINHTQLKCNVPPGCGGTNTMVVCLPDTSNCGSPSLFLYISPTIVNMSLPPTNGMDGYSQSATILSHTTLSVCVPVGSGSGHLIQVVVQNLGSNLLTFSYHVPEINRIESVKTSGGKLTIFGTNFGPLGTPVLVSLEGLGVQCSHTPKCICSNASISIAHTEISCSAPPGVGGDHTINITIPANNYGLSTSSNIFAYSSPIVTSTSPTSTTGGITVIEGDNFGLSNTTIAVYLFVLGNYSRCTDLSVSIPHLELQCRMPEGYGENLPLKITILEGYPGSQSVDASFSYQAPVVLSSTQTNTTGGIVQITGVNFGPLALTDITVTIAGTKCKNPNVSVAHTQVTCTADKGAGAQQLIEVTVPAGSNQQGRAYVFSYFRPQITYVPPVPTTASKPVHLIQGVNFSPFNNISALVVIEGITTVATWDSATSIYASFPEGVGANLSLTVTVANQTSDNFLWNYQPPVIEFVSEAPDENQVGITIGGSAFGKQGDNIFVFLDSVPSVACSNVEVTIPDVLLWCAMPPDYVWSGGVSVIVPFVPGHKQQGDYLRTTSAPVISYVTSVDTTGGSITIIGNNLWNSHTVVVTVGNSSCNNVTVDPPTVVTCIAPPGVGSGLRVTVSVGDLKGEFPSFSYNAPIILSATPAPTVGTVTTTIYGNNFGPVGTPVTVMLEFTDEPGVLKECNNGGNQTLVTAEGKITFPSNLPSTESLTSSAAVFSYEIPRPLTTSSVDTTGGYIFINGTNFCDSTTSATVTIEKIPCTNATILTPTSIACLAPAGTGQGKCIEITIPAGSDQTSNLCTFHYNDPVIYSATNVSTEGGVTSISGLNFGKDSSIITVKIEQNVCGNVTILDDHVLLSCVAPAGIGTNLQLSVTVGVQKSSAFNGFSYVDVTPPYCQLYAGFTESSSTKFVVDLQCREIVYNVSTSAFTASGCAVEHKLDTTPRQNYKIPLKQVDKAEECTITLKPLIVYDAAHNFNNGSNTLTVKVTANSTTEIIIGLVLGLVFLGAVGALAGFVFFMKKRNQKPQEEGVVMSDLFGAVEDENDEEKFDTSQSSEVALPECMLEVSVSTLKFGLNYRQCPVGEKISETVSLVNSTGRPIYFKFFPQRSYKYKMVVDPVASVIDPTYAMDVTLHMIVTCTTVIESFLLLACSPGEQLDGDELQHCKIPFKIESRLSTKLDPEELDLVMPPIGEGTFGTVYRGTWRGQAVAVKVLKSKGISSKEKVKEFTREVQIMEELQSPQIINFIGSVQVKSQLAIVTEFMSLGNLESVMKKQTLSLKQKTKILLDCAKGMNFLHQSGVIHRDLKAGNLLISSLDPTSIVCVKISDFGTTREVNSAKDQMTMNVGTPTHMAPEVIETGNYTSKADVFSFGILAYTLLTGTEPYTSEDFSSAPWKIAEFVISGKRMKIPDSTPYPDLIEACWAPDPNERPDFGAVSEALERMLNKL
ncbi:tyrosine protein kinase [Pelomyxa schiedti]|nr:tyrosine protein kinase [Pelomyxa schiedti]